MPPFNSTSSFAIKMNRRRFLFSATSILVAGGLGGIYWRRRWKYIVVHHSAGSFGNIEFLQKVHSERQPRDPIKAIPYHYVLGNGNGLKLGEIASDWRQTWDLWGSHVSANNMDRNIRGIGICMIGNFETAKVPVEQYQALVKLTKNILSAYDITIENVHGHGMLPGESTKCPGKNFPMERFRRDLLKTNKALPAA
jgi:hypothetical protein